MIKFEIWKDKFFGTNTTLVIRYLGKIKAFELPWTATRKLEGK